MLRDSFEAFIIILAILMLAFAICVYLPFKEPIDQKGYDRLSEAAVKMEIAKDRVIHRRQLRYLDRVSGWLDCQEGRVPRYGDIR